MDRLYAPWRSVYTEAILQTKDDTAIDQECVFCTHVGDAIHDEERFVLGRFTHNLVILNLYPYNAGHLLIVPYMHESRLDGLLSEARAELMELTMHSEVILREVLKAQGVNVGMNLGKYAGAGIPTHLHQHVLPRWAGDTNFLPLLARTKQISFDLNDIFQKLSPAFAQIKIKLG